MKTIVTSENLEQWIGGEIIVPKEFETLNSFQAPISLVWELTGKCMSNCIYCSGGFPKKTNDMTSEQRMKLADELIAMKIFMISLSGGDPLLCNDLERLVEKFTDAGISTMICSPGLLIDEMQIERLCRNSLVAFNISLDSVNSKINDYQRGREGACDSAKRLISYIDKYGLRSMTVTEKCDDGYSGTNMNRPGMQELLAMVKEQRVDCIIVKDMSRFARNYLETGKYIEQIFPFMGIRFIAINDNYDSKDYVGGIGEIDVQFKALLYDFYSKDLSQKVSTAVMARKDKGMFIGICAPFGYLKSKNNACELLVDEEAAAVVKSIFTLRAGGASIAGIVRTLNGEGIDTPAAYHRRKGTYANMYTKGDSPLWTDYKVNSILNNEMYIGTFVYGKSRVKEIGSRRKKMLPPSEWKRIPNHHEAIVSKEVYEKVQAMKGTVPEAFTPVGKKASVYTGRLVCNCCGRNMIYHKDRLGKRFFNCEVNYRKNNNCVHRVLVTDLDGIIKGELSKQISGLAKLKLLMEKEREQHNERIRGAKQRLAMAEDTHRRLELELRTAYESYAKGVTDRETYLMQKQSYEAMIDGIREKIEAQKEAIFTLENQMPSENSGIQFLEGKSEIAEITDELLDVLLDKVVVYADKTIELRWKFSNRSN